MRISFFFRSFSPSLPCFSYMSAIIFLFMGMRRQRMVMIIIIMVINCNASYLIITSSLILQVYISMHTYAHVSECVFVSSTKRTLAKPCSIFYQLYQILCAQTCTTSSYSMWQNDFLSRSLVLRFHDLERGRLTNSIWSMRFSFLF